MGKKDASVTGLPLDQYRKQIGKQDYKKTKPALKATRLKAEAKKYSSGFRVRLAWSYFLFMTTDVCIYMSSLFLLLCLFWPIFVSVCLSVYFPFVSVCLFQNVSH
uniref:Triple QxxK/R motif-containing protein n=1 Tax=Sander lucioperca TaxID=283035 RepID=A0A8C9YC05_SANLU